MISLQHHKQKNKDPQSIFILIKHFENQKAKRLSEAVKGQLQNLESLQNGWTLLHMCASAKNIEMAKYYLQQHKKGMSEQGSTYNSDSKAKWINQKDKEGLTCLHYAVFAGRLDMVQLLQENGADIYQINSEGLTVVHIAAQADSPLLIYYFLSKGLKIGVKDYKGNTPLHWACYSGMQNAVTALISWQAEIDRRQDNYGMTPLHLAVMSGNSRIVKKLLIKGCDRNIVSYMGKSPLDIARQNNFENVIEMIKDQKGICQIFSFKTPLKKPNQYGIHFYSFLFLFLSCYLLNTLSFVLCFDLNQLPLVGVDLAYLIVGAITFILFLAVTFSNPGKLSNRIHRHRQFFEKLQNKKPSTLCFDCGIIKPERSKHCQICQSCISVFDHHCPWLANCVGASNFALFYIFVLILLLFVLFSFVISIVGTQFNIKGFTHIQQVGIVGIIASAYSLVLTLIFVGPITLLLILQTRNALLNKTTYENHINNIPIKRHTPQSNRSQRSSISQSLKSNNVETDSIYRASSKRTVQEQQKGWQWRSNIYKMCWANRHNVVYRSSI